MLWKHVYEALTWTTVRLGKYRNIGVNGIIKIRMLKQTLCKEIVSALFECFIGMNVRYDWGMSSIVHVIKPEPVNEV